MLLIILVASCAGPNTVVDTPSIDGEIAGFFKGLLHGIIAPVTFVISLFSDKVSMYEVHNTGALYDLGFALGAMIIVGGGGRSSSRRK